MSRIHVLQMSGNNVYSCICHATTPGGNNSAGVLWADALKNAGLAQTAMPAGTGAGQITPAEQAQVEAGAVIEAAFQWGDDPAWDNPTRMADLNTRAAQAVADVLATYAAKLKYFGFTVA